MLKTLFRLSTASVALTLTIFGMDIKDLDKDTAVPKALYINCLQRTQTQQLLKNYIMVGLESSYKNPKETLAEAIPKYDKRFQQFDTYFRARIKDKEHIEYLDKARKTWADSKPLLEQKPTKENAKILYVNFRNLVKYLGKAKVLAKKSFKAVGMTGSLCRDPLYMSNLYLMDIWGVDMPESKKIMGGIVKHFNGNISKLKAYEGNDDETNKFIKKTEKAFMIFEIMYDNDNVKVPTMISKNADKIFLYIRTLKQLYGKKLK